jgi:hypothetical protein
LWLPAAKQQIIITTTTTTTTSNQGFLSPGTSTLEPVVHPTT